MRKGIILSLVFIIIIGMMSFTYGQRTEVQVKVRYGKDYTNHWANADIQYLMNEGIINGYPGGYFKPVQDVTRAEFVKMINEALGFSQQGQVDFLDIEERDWFYDHVVIGLGEGYLEGYEDGTFQPNKNISRQEVATIVARVMNLEEVDSPTMNFSDAETIADFARGWINSVVAENYMQGYPEGIFNPFKSLSRAEAARIIINIFDIQAIKAADKPMISWVDDDGNKGFYTKLKPFVEEYNIPFTSAIITNRGFGGRYMTLAQMQEMADLGCEFVSHMHSHDKNRWPATMTSQELHFEFSTSQKIIKDLGFNDKIVVYPFGSENQLVRNIASQYYEIGIDTYNTNIPLGNIVAGKNLDPYRIERVNAQFPDINQIYKKMDKAVRKDSWIILVSHVDQGGWYSKEKVRNLIEYALDAGLEFVTLEEGYSRILK